MVTNRGIAQLVEQRSPKPRAEGSSPSAPAKTQDITFRGVLFLLLSTFGFIPYRAYIFKHKHYLLLVSTFAAGV